MQPPYLLGLCGPAGVGKSTVAATLAQHHAFQRLRFAGTLKKMLRALGLSEAQVDGDEKETPCDLLGGKTPRQAMQTLGTQWGRDCVDADIWVRATLAQADLRLRIRQSVVIDDVRFDNEAQAILQRGGVVIKLSRAGFAHSDVHASEVGISADFITHIVPNNSTPEEAADHAAWWLRNMS